MGAKWENSGPRRRVLVDDNGRIIGAIRRAYLTWVTEGSELAEYTSREAAERAVERRVINGNGEHNG